MQTVQTNETFEVLATFITGITYSTAPKYKYPAIGDVMGIGNEVITVTADNQKEFTAPYVLEGLDEITLLTGGFKDRIQLTHGVSIKGWLLDVVNAELTPNKLTVTVSLNVNAEDEDQAITTFRNELKGYELHCLEFMDTNTNEVYYIEVDSIQNEEMEFDIID